jgi:glutathione S-transferase
MKLYFSPGACSLSAHIALCESGLPFESEQVALSNKQTKSGVDFTTINPKGYVPALQIGEGQVLTEGVAIVQYIADQKPETHLAPAAGTLDRYRLQEWLTFISSEIHKGFSPLFNPKVPDEYKAIARENLARRFSQLSEMIGSKTYVMGDTFTVADGYLFTILNWANFVKVDLSPYPVLVAYQGRVAQRPAVQAALRAEGLLQLSADPAPRAGDSLGGCALQLVRSSR